MRMPDQASKLDPGWQDNRMRMPDIQLVTMLLEEGTRPDMITCATCGLHTPLQRVACCAKVSCMQYALSLSPPPTATAPHPSSPLSVLTPSAWHLSGPCMSGS